MYAVIMAGGSGTRFWPASRTDKPKQFLSITGRSPMVVETCDRLCRIIPEEQVILVLGRQHESEAREMFRERRVHMLLEPFGRNTAPCIGVGALYARHIGCRDAVAFLPADHHIGDPGAFLSVLKSASHLASTSGALVTLGIVPTRPETGYGYIRRDGKTDECGDTSGYRVSAFVEKPDFKTALTYVTSGEYYWNSGIFVATPDAILGEIEAHLPVFYRGILELEKVLDSEAFGPVLEKVYREIDGTSFDYAVMEKTGSDVIVIPCECGWSDVGSWSSLYDLREDEQDEHRNLKEGEVLLRECEGSFVSARSGRLVACLGLKNLLVVDSPDALLVSDLGRSQEIRKIAEQLKREGKEALL